MFHILSLKNITLKLGFLTRGMRHALSVMRYATKIATTHYSRYDSLHTVSVYGMRHAVCGMLYAANRIPPCSDPCGIRMQNRTGKSTNDVINYDIPEHPLHFVYLITVAQVL